MLEHIGELSASERLANAIDETMTSGEARQRILAALPIPPTSPRLSSSAFKRKAASQRDAASFYKSGQTTLSPDRDMSLESN